MKKLVLALAIMVSALSFAQEGKRERMTAEQRTDKQVKEMTASLNLTEKQQGEVKALLMEQAKKREAKKAEMKANRESGQEMSDEQRADMKKRMIDEQLEVKTKMKKILTEEQLQKMQEIRREKGKDMMHKRKEVRKAAKKAE